MAALLVSTVVRAQFNPDNPEEPGTHPWRLTLKTVPADGGYFNIYAQSQHAAGEEVSIVAYNHSSFAFQQWEDEKGTVLATANSMTFTMPAQNVTLVARYAYTPDTPDEPGQASIRRHLYLRTNPEGAGWFNMYADNDIATGEAVNLHAYANQHYTFRSWTLGGNVISTSESLVFTMPEQDATLVANYDYNLAPDNPDEPGEPQGNIYIIYCMRAQAMAGHTIAYPIHLQNRGEALTGFAFTLQLPDALTADVAAATLTDRAAAQSIEAVPTGNSSAWANITTTTTEAMPQDIIHLAWQVRNDGNLAGSGGWTERIYLISANGRRVNIGSTYYDTETLPPGQTVERSADIRLAQLPSIDGKADLGVTIIPAVSSGEVADLLTNNSAQTNGAPIHIGKKLYLTLPLATLQESDATTMRCQLARSGNSNTAETFKLTKAKGDNRIVVPETVTIPREQAAAYFYLTLNDNSICDDDSVFTLQAEGNGYDAVEGSIVVSDDEMPPLHIKASASEVNEGDVFQITVSIDKPIARGLAVTLACDRSTRFSYPKTVTLPAGDTEATVSVTAIDDISPNSTEIVEFFATAEGFGKASTAL